MYNETIIEMSEDQLEVAAPEDRETLGKVMLRTKWKPRRPKRQSNYDQWH